MTNRKTGYHWISEVRYIKRIRAKARSHGFRPTHDILNGYERTSNAYKLKRVYATYVQSIVNRDIVGYEVR